MSLLADRILYKKNWVSGGVEVGNGYERLLALTAQKLYSSKIITLDNETAAFAYQLSRMMTPEEIVNNLQYFRMPSDRLWIEFDRRSFFNNPSLDAGKMVFFLERRTDTQFAIHIIEEWEKDEEPHPIIMPIGLSFLFDTNWELLKPTKRNRFNLSLRQHMRYGYGYGYEPDPDGLDFVPRLLTQHFDVTFMYEGEPGIHFNDMSRDSLSTIHGQLNEVAGVMRHVLTLLMLYHFPPVERYERKPKEKGRRVINGKSRPYFSFEDMKISWPRRKPINPLKWVKKGLPAMPQHKREHEVEGHWRKLRPLTGPELAALGRPQEELLPHEFYKHTWVRDHKRGDASLGVVQKRKHIHSSAVTS